MTRPDDANDDPVERRMAALLSVAFHHGTAVPLDDLPSLLPADGPATLSEVERWVRAHPGVARLDGTSILASGIDSPDKSTTRERRLRGESYLKSATALFSGPLAPSGMLLRCACVTGSTAYQEPRDGDDLDIMIVARRGTTWLCLLSVFLWLRLRRNVQPPDGAEWCFNFVLDEYAATESYAVRQGFLFAREALTARTLSGADFYRELLESSPWMAEELPRLYSARMAPDSVRRAPREKAAITLRAISALVYPILASFLQLKGLYQNARLRREGRTAESF
ncbi:MAG: hypothetical protein L3K17_09645, partial [Thermoplasmata archaeon]|nr:hypothetical protein [Thermoplasmata archaeon]